MFKLLNRAREYLNLSPGERALLKILEGLLVSAVLAGLVAGFSVLSTQDVSKINWSAVLATFIAAALKTLYDGVSKYFKSFGDPWLPSMPSNSGE